jgi:hypothetical protein
MSDADHSHAWQRLKEKFESLANHWPANGVSEFGRLFCRLKELELQAGRLLLDEQDSPLQQMADSTLERNPLLELTIAYAAEGDTSEWRRSLARTIWLQQVADLAKEAPESPIAHEWRDYQNTGNLAPLASCYADAASQLAHRTAAPHHETTDHLESIKLDSQDQFRVLRVLAEAESGLSRTTITQRSSGIHGPRDQGKVGQHVARLKELGLADFKNQQAPVHITEKGRRYFEQAGPA